MASNESFASLLCAQTHASTADSLTILSTGAIPSPFVLPSCLRTEGSSFLSFTAYPSDRHLIISNFSHLPPNINSLTLLYTILAPVGNLPSDEYDGFDESGNLAWDEIWAALPNLTQITITSSCLLQGKLPDSLPAGLRVFVAAGTGLRGTIPPTLFANSKASLSMQFSVSGNPISGSIPSGLFDTWNGAQKALFFFDLAQCSLTGTIPTDIWQPLHAMNSPNVNIYLHDNRFIGSIPSFPAGMASKNFVFLAASNEFSGSLPPSFISFPMISAVTLDLSFNKFTGSLPAQLFAPSWSLSGSPNVALMMSNNQFSGSIPSTFLTGGMVSSAAVTSLLFKLENNLLTGSVPAYLLYRDASRRSQDKKTTELEETDGAENSIFSESTSSHTSITTSTGSKAWVITQSVSILLGSNRLTGSIPAEMFSQSYGITPFSVRLSVTNNPGISGTIPSSFFLGASGALDAMAVTTLTLDASHTNVFGSPPADFCESRAAISINLSNTKLNGTIPAEWAHGCKFLTISIGNCPDLSTTLPLALFTNSTITSFKANNTPLNGTMPPLSATLTDVDLSSTNIDFCHSDNASLAVWGTNEHSCLLKYTSTCNCMDSFSSACSVTPTCSAAPCTGPPPSIEFYCDNGVWTAPTTSAPIFVIPPGVGTVVITGNLTSTSIVIQGFGTSVEIAGCAGNLTTITVELTLAQLEQLKDTSKTLQPLISTSNQSCSNLNNVNVIATVKSGGCKKVKAQKVVSDSGSSLGAYFTLDKSGCNTWWIILVSVVCGVVVLAVIALLLLVALYPPFREKIRPFSKGRAAQGDLN